MRIWLDMPHGVGEDRGAASNFANEEIESDKLTSIVKSKLEGLGHTVNRTRPTNPNHTERSSCQERANNANDWGADLFVSVHNNAGGGEGTEILTYGGEQTPLAKRYLQYILNHGGKTHDGTLKHNSIPGAVKDGTGYIVINQSKMQACIIECFYVDTQSDYDFYKNNIEMFANAIVYGITGVDLRMKTQIKSHRNCIVYAKGAEIDKHIANCFGMYLDDCIVVDHTQYVKGMGKSVYSIGALTGVECNVAIRGKDRRDTFEKAMSRVGFKR